MTRRIRPKKKGNFHQISRAPFFRMRPIPAGMMYALTRLGSGKARCFSSKSSRSCVGSPKTKRPGGSGHTSETEKWVAYSWLIVPCTSYETLLRDSKSLEDLRGMTSYQSYLPWHAHNFRTQSRPDLDSFQ